MGRFLKVNNFAVSKNHLWNNALNLTFTHVQGEGNVTLEPEHVMINVHQNGGLWHAAGGWQTVIPASHELCGVAESCQAINDQFIQ